MSAAPDMPDARASARGLKGGALGFVSSVGIGVASTAPAYSLAATLGFAVAVVGPQTLLLVPLAFIPMFFSAWANKEMNRADPDCGSSFTWAARAIGPRFGWFFGGWGTIASDLLAMASQSQIAGQYFFLLFGITSVGDNATSIWVLLVGVAWIVVLTYLCYRGIELSARIQIALLAVEIIMLLLMSVVALVKVGTGSAPAGHAPFSWDWLNPAHFASPSTFMAGMLLMVFVYWGWDTTVSVNEETADSDRIPGTAGVVSTLLLLGTYFVVILSVQMFAGFGSSGIGLDNSANQNDVLSPMGEAVFGHSALGTVLSRLLLLMVLTSSAATTQTTILPNARTTLSMAFHKALPAIFGKIHPKYLTPSFSTISFAVISVIMYVILNFVSGGNVLADSVTAATFFVAMYLGSTGFACFWFYRKSLLTSAGNFWLRGVIPLLSGIMLLVILGWSVYFYTDPNQSYSTWHMAFWPHWTVGGVLSIGIITSLVGLAWMLATQPFKKEFFSGRSMKEGYSITDDDRVVPIAATAAAGTPETAASAGAEADTAG
jgi:amino acid transporter